MPWGGKGNKRYFYLSVRVNSRPHTIYVGTGRAAEAVAAEIEKRKAARLAHREALASLNRSYEQAVGLLLQLDPEANEVLNQAMTDAGFYRHDRGPWRKRQRERPNIREGLSR